MDAKFEITYIIHIFLNTIDDKNFTNASFAVKTYCTRKLVFVYYNNNIVIIMDHVVCKITNQQSHSDDTAIYLELNYLKRVFVLNTLISNMVKIVNIDLLPRRGVNLTNETR